MNRRYTIRVYDTGESDKPWRVTVDRHDYFDETDTDLLESWGPGKNLDRMLRFATETIADRIKETSGFRLMRERDS